jgi:aspartate/methionine/tyrosine aminotransferase
MHLSENVRQIEGSSTLAIAALCRQLRAQGRDIIDLGVGEPDFRTPEFIAQAGIASIVQGMTQYTPVAGVPELRDAIARSIASATGQTVDATSIVVTSGAKQALFNACFTLFGPGDEVLLPAPYWTSYPALIRLARAEPRVVPTSSEHGFKPSIAELEAASSPRTRGIILNSPSNPTGAVYSRNELAEIAAWARDRDIWIISDEIYGRICFTAARAPSVVEVVDSLDHVVLVDGASKAFAMTGWRLGFSCTTPALADKLTALQSQITSGASAAAQYAGIAAFTDTDRANASIRAMESVFRMRRDKIIAHFQEHAPDVYCFPPEGAFYVFVRVDNFFSERVRDSAAFCRWILEETDVALVPGSAFGDDRFVRLSFAAPEAALAEAIRRIGRVLQPAVVRA